MPHPLPHTRVPSLVFPTSSQANSFIAKKISDLVRARNAASKATVLGLATGSTPVGLYRELIRLHREDGLDLSRVVTFNLDEYYPMPKEDSHSYFRWMHETFFNHVNIRWENIHIPDGTLLADDVDGFCAAYERKILDFGGIDIQILGIGRTGHIGFNEPGSVKSSRTRLVTLDSITRRDAAASFYGEENVPSQAITMGVATILSAKTVYLLAFGEHKAGIVYKAAENPPTEAVTASFLQDHPNSTFILDQAAAAELTAIKRPWESGLCEWTPELTRRAVVHLSLSQKKSLQKLNDEDFRDHHLYELLRSQGNAQKIGAKVFEDLLETIKLYPAGKDPKSILVFSPHPDDDVISMGATIIRLVGQGHKVHVAYMTSGNIAVFDHDARRFVDFVEEFVSVFGTASEQSQAGTIKERVMNFLDSKKPGQQDSQEVLTIKGMIRATEARAAALACGIPPEQLEFMNLRFYRTGTISKNPVQPEDVADIVELFNRLKPAQIYVAGEMSDPHGTHRLCAEAIFQAVREHRSLGREEFEVWLYRGAWEEWEPHEIEMAVPINPEVLEQKKQSIFRHQSQKDRAMFPGGTDRREFWQRAEDRNLGTAKIYDLLGLPEYYGLEAFVRWKE
jgi:glucosamine-6-phosphate deaminase